MVLIIVSLIALMLIVRALNIRRDEHSKKEKVVNYTLGIIGLAFIVYLLTCGFRTTPYIESGIQEFSLEKLPSTPYNRYFVVYSVDDNTDLVEVSKCDVNYNSNKNIIQIYKRRLPDFLLYKHNIPKVIIYTTRGPMGDEQEMLKGIKHTHRLYS